MTRQAASGDQRLSALRRVDLILGVGIAALALLVWLQYSDELRAILDGLGSFSSVGLVLLVGLIAALVIFLGLPMLAGDPAAEASPALLHGTARQNRALEILYAEKLRLLRAIRDLDFDFDMGKLIDATYAEQRVLLIRQAIAVLARLDALEGAIQAQQQRIEAALTAFRQENT